MPLKHLEHEGNEDFGVILNRTAVKKKMKELKELSDDKREERLEERQAKYFNENNPALWTGEI